MSGTPPIPQTILIRHDSADRFAANNPILGAGELAHAINAQGLHTLKSGDGKTPYNNLPTIADSSTITAIAALQEAIAELPVSEDGSFGTLDDFDTALNPPAP